MNVLRSSRRGLIAAATALTLGAALAMPTAASAAVSSTAVDSSGWLRLGHFSPDTKDVDVRVAALSGGSILFELDDVGYGDISDYQSLPVGSYTVSMIPSGTDDWTKLALSAAVTVTDDTATTAAAYGPSDDLKVQLFSDDLSTPSEGNARIRVIQTSTLTPTVDVATADGTSIASGARAGTATSYAEVPAGDWDLRLTGEGVSDSADVSLAAGSVTSLFVLDTADGGLTIVPILDSAAVGVAPIGGVATGGGWLSDRDQASGSFGWIAATVAGIAGAFA